ncbi:MAG: rRNA methyltransferase [Bacteroidetes bacterium]|nr:MAG: rRNA methyltransferase [Bacteroidota bacterium]
MELPLFFHDDPISVNDLVSLSPDASKHIGQVLRLRTGDAIKLTDGKGNFWIATITSNDKKNSIVRVLDHTIVPGPEISVTIAISLLKNAGRFEWFIEKATEIGVSKIIPLICERTERQHFRAERLKNILISAMLQSGQARLARLHDPIEYPKFISEWDGSHHQFIAHCMDGDKKHLADEIARINSGHVDHDARIILIGPEGDFTRDEVEAAIAKKFIAVSLGSNRLRAETAGLVAATLISL